MARYRQQILRRKVTEIFLQNSRLRFHPEKNNDLIGGLMMSRLSSSYLSLIEMVKQLSSLVKMDFNRFLNKSDYHILWSKSEITPPPDSGF